MSILYGCIAKESQILVDYAEFKGDFIKMTKKLLPGVQRGAKGKVSSEDGEIVFYFSNNEIVTYMIICGNTFKDEYANIYFDEIDELFNQIVPHEEIEKLDNMSKSEIDYCLKDKFESSLRGKIKYFSNPINLKQLNQEDNKVDILKSNVIETNRAVIEANEELIKRGQNLNMISEKAEELLLDTVEYLDSSKRVRKKAGCNSRNYILLIILIVLLIAYVIACIVCKTGLVFTHCKK